MATPNYGWEKRQRELAKKRKKEEKANRKGDHKPVQDESTSGNAAPSKEVSNAGNAEGSGAV